MLSRVVSSRIATTAVRSPRPTPRLRAAISLLEVMVVLTVIGILLSMSAPSFTRSIEQSHADIAGANLRAIWAAQRLYWLENRIFAPDLPTLAADRLIDPTIVAGSARYSYQISYADTETFTAAAIRTGSTRWSGQFTLNDTGVVTGAISASGVADISPGFLE
jgi:Tfp pilus assembly protein PilE